jgi:hypothetical protein
MQDKTISLVLVILGVLVVAVSLLADLLGLGIHPGIGIYQLGEAGLGLIIVFAGVWIYHRRKQ